MSAVRVFASPVASDTSPDGAALFLGAGSAVARQDGCLLGPDSAIKVHEQSTSEPLSNGMLAQ